MIVLAFAFLLAASLFFTACLQLTKKTAYLLSLYLFSFAEITLISYILSALGWLNRPWAFLILQLVFVLVGAYLWFRTGRPSLLGPFADWLSYLNRKMLVDFVRSSPALAILALGIGSVYLISLILGVTVPQNNMDSLSTHLSRIGHWFQLGSFNPWPTLKLHQVSYPVNAQLQMYWSLLFLQRDTLVTGMQWLAALASGLGVFGMARFLGYRRKASAFAALVYLGFPLIVLQSSTTQNDVVTATLYVLAVYFFFAGVSNQNRPMLFLSALAVGLGLGTKQTYYFLLPGLAVLAVCALFQYGKKIWNGLFFWGVVGIVTTLVFGFYYNLIVWKDLGSPWGPPEYVASQTGGTDLSSIANRIAYNVPRFLYQAIDTSGLPRPYAGYAHKSKAWVATRLSNLTGITLEGTQYAQPSHEFLYSTENVNEESNAWYGPLSFLLLFPALLYESGRGLQQRSYLKPGLFASAVLFLLIDTALRPGWDPYQGRYFAPVVATSAPLMAVWFSGRRAWSRWLIVALALVIAFTTVLYNPAKPILGKYADDIGIWSHDRIFLETVQRKRERDMQYMVARDVPDDAVLGYYDAAYALDYILFGEHLTRVVVPIYPLDKVTDQSWLDQHKIDYILVPDQGVPPVPVLPTFELIDQVNPGQLDGWELYRRISSP